MILVNVPLHFPEARNWMWDYCMYLGPYTSASGIDYDLGVCFTDIGISLAVVHGNEEGEYISGLLNVEYAEPHMQRIVIEVRARLQALGYSKQLAN